MAQKRTLVSMYIKNKELIKINKFTTRPNSLHYVHTIKQTHEAVCYTPDIIINKGQEIKKDAKLNAFI